MPRNIDFFDGAQSNSVPTIGDIVASKLSTYANDAAYETAEGAAEAGDMYHRTSDGAVRHYNGSAWESLAVSPIAAADVTYDNSTSSMTAIDVQGAIDEVEGRVDTNEADISNSETDISNLETLSGEAGSTDHGTFTGSTISDNTTTHNALQELETAVELKVDTSSVGAANGVASLDGSGKVPTSQLPTALMEYEGDWDASTNTPTLANTDTGVQGTVYRVTAAGTVDFGAGNITFAVGDWAYNNGTTWEKSVETTLPDTDSLPEGATNLYNQTHTGEVTGATGLVLDNTAISNKTNVTAAATDEILIGDASDSGNLKKVTAQSIADLATSGGTAKALTSKTANYTALTSDEVILCDASSGAFTITLPTSFSKGSGKQFIIKKTDSSANKISVTRSGSDLLEGLITIDLYDQGLSLTFIADGTSDYYII